jgi:hypothetical protein
MTFAQWAFWLALGAFIAASGKFLDDYHIKTATKTKIREVLVKWFIWLDAHKVPDLGGVVLKGFRAVLKIRRFLLVAVSPRCGLLGLLCQRFILAGRFSGRKSISRI